MLKTALESVEYWVIKREQVTNINIWDKPRLINTGTLGKAIGLRRLPAWCVFFSKIDAAVYYVDFYPIKGEEIQSKRHICY